MGEPFPKTKQLGRPKTSEPRKFRAVANAKHWSKLHAAKQGPCRICGRPPRNSLHHLVPRSLGGDDTYANLVPLCGSGTTGCHGLIEARNPVALASLALLLDDNEYAYIVGKLGENATERLFGV